MWTNGHPDWWLLELASLGYSTPRAHRFSLGRCAYCGHPQPLAAPVPSGFSPFTDLVPGCGFGFFASGNAKRTAGI